MKRIIITHSFLSSKTLKEYDKILSEYQFLRVHKSHLVNQSYVLKYDKKGILYLKDNSQVEVSRRRKTWVIEQLKKN